MQARRKEREHTKVVTFRQSCIVEVRMVGSGGRTVSKGN